MCRLLSPFAVALLLHLLFLPLPCSDAESESHSFHAPALSPRPPQPPPSPPLTHSSPLAANGYLSSFSKPLVAIFIILSLLLFICTYVRVRLLPPALPPGIGDDFHVRYYGPAAPIRALQTEDNQSDWRSRQIQRLPTLQFSSEGAMVSADKELQRHSQQKDTETTGNKCTICISDYRNGQVLRLLPACGHFFHKDCIDEWLFSHGTCPLCRLSLFNDKGDLIVNDVDEVPIFRFSGCANGADVDEHTRSTSSQEMLPKPPSSRDNVALARATDASIVSDNEGIVALTICLDQKGPSMPITP